MNTNIFDLDLIDSCVPCDECNNLYSAISPEHSQASSLCTYKIPDYPIFVCGYGSIYDGNSFVILDDPIINKQEINICDCCISLKLAKQTIFELMDDINLTDIKNFIPSLTGDKFDKFQQLDKFAKEISYYQSFNFEEYIKNNPSLSIDEFNYFKQTFNKLLLNHNKKLKFK